MNPPCLWQDGWYQKACHSPSPNFTLRPIGRDSIDLIVIHSISLPPGQYGSDHVQALFTNQLNWTEHPYFQTLQGLQVSAHFYIRRDGTIWQFVSCDHRAWHAGASQFRKRINCNDFSIGIELEGLEGETFESAQYTQLCALITDICTHYPIQFITGHEHIAPERKHDPGEGFNWLRLQRQLNWPSSHCGPEANIAN